MEGQVSAVSLLLSNIEGAEQSYQRVASEIEAVTGELPFINFDLVSGASMILGVYPRIATFRERMLALSEFDIRNLDSLKDYVIAAWYVYVTNLPGPEPAEVDALVSEASALKSKFLIWAEPLVASGVFEKDAVDKIKVGSGFKDTLSDVVALVGLYRSKWDECRHICAVTEADLERAAVVGPRGFALIGHREQRLTNAAGEGLLRVRKAWALPERAYAQCRRALAYLRFEQGDVEDIAPNIRRNSGPTRNRQAAEPAAPTIPTPPATPVAPLGGNPIGGGDSPFATKT